MIVFYIIIGIIIGLSISKISLLIKEHLSKKEVIEKYKNVFNELESSIGTDSLKFINRLNQLCVFKFSGSHGVFDIVMNLDNYEITLMKENKVEMSSNDKISEKIIISKDDTSRIVFNVLNKIADVSDVVELPGALVDRKSFEKMANNMVVMQPQSPKKKKVKPQLDIDSILDKIKNVGVDGLTKEERKFLDDQSKK